MRRLVLGAAVAAAGVLAGCTQPAQEPAPPSEPEAVTSEAPPVEGETVEIADNSGVKVVPFAPERVAAADDRSLELLRALGVEAVPVAEANDPQLVVVGAGAVPEEANDGVVVDVSPRPEPPLDWEMVRQVQILGQIFGKEEEAKQLDDAFSSALERARPFVRESWTAAGVRTERSELGLQPENGDDLWQPVFTMLGLKPALKLGSADLTGDEAADALAEAKPDTILVTDVDPNLSSPAYVPPMKLLLNSEKLADVPAIQAVNIYVAPMNAGQTASIITYTLMLNELANHWSLVG